MVDYLAKRFAGRGANERALEVDAQSATTAAASGTTW
jgi:hypothetical protein